MLNLYPKRPVFSLKTIKGKKANKACEGKQRPAKSNTPKLVDSFSFHKLPKMFKFSNQCFVRLGFWKSVSDSRNLLDGAAAVLLETLFQNRSRAKH